MGRLFARAGLYRRLRGRAIGVRGAIPRKGGRCPPPSPSRAATRSIPAPSRPGRAPPFGYAPAGSRGATAPGSRAGFLVFPKENGTPAARVRQGGAADGVEGGEPRRVCGRPFRARPHFGDGAPVFAQDPPAPGADAGRVGFPSGARRSVRTAPGRRAPRRSNPGRSQRRRRGRQPPCCPGRIAWPENTASAPSYPQRIRRNGAPGLRNG